MTRRILIGYLTDGEGGLNRYLKQVVEYLGKDAKTDFLISCKPSDEVKEFLDNHDCRLFTIPSLREYTARIDCLRQIMKNNRYDVFYANVSTLALWRDVKIAKECGIPKRIVQSHATGINESSRIRNILVSMMHNYGKKQISKYATDFIAVSKISGDWLYPKKTNYSIIYNALDFDKMSFNLEGREYIRKSLDIDNNTFVVGFLSLLNYQKNVFYLLDIFKELRMMKQNVKLLIVGDGPDKEELMKKVREEHIENVIFYGYAKDNQRDLYSAMDIFVFPSRFEGFGVVCIEAQANGCVSLLSDRISDEVVIADKKVEFLCIEEEPIIWAKEICDKIEKGIDHEVIIQENKRELFSESKQKETIRQLLLN